MSNKKDWDSFTRSKNRFRCHDYYESNRIDLFNMWLDCDKSWDKVILEVERIHKLKSEAKRGWVAVQGKDIKRTHDDDKAKALIASRKASGLWYPSEDFENDDDDAFSGLVYFLGFLAGLCLVCFS